MAGTAKVQIGELRPSAVPPLRLSLVALVVSLGSAFNFGYQLIITNPAQKAFLHFLNQSYLESHGEVAEPAYLKSVWGVIVGSLFWGSTIGALLIQLTAEHLGRKWGCLLAYAVQAAAMAMSIVSYQITSYALFAVSRLLMGVAIAVGLGISPMFITECSPKECRGVISLMTGILMQLSIVLGSVIGMPRFLGTSTHWFWLYAIQLAWTLFACAVLPFIHESPGYLHSRGNDKAAISSVMFYHNVDRETASRVLTAQVANTPTQHALSPLAIWKDRKAMRGIMVGCAVMFCMVMSGIAVVNAFAVEILQGTGLSLEHACIANVGICLFSLVGVAFSSFVIERSGRRPLLLFSNGGLLLTNLLIVTLMYAFQAHKEQWIGMLLTGAICIFMIVFACGSGPVAFFITGELVEQHARAAGSVWVNIIMGGGRSILLSSFFPLKHAIGGPSAYLSLFVGPLAAAVCILYFYLPETKNKTIAEVEASIDDLPRIRKVRRRGVPREQEMQPLNA